VTDHHKNTVKKVFSQMENDIGAANYSSKEKETLENAVARMSAAGVDLDDDHTMSELIAGDEDGAYKKYDGVKDFVKTLTKIYEKSVDG
jgi:CRISPR/Cas system CMR-associated protein Cmr5 small subunit